MSFSELFFAYLAVFLPSYLFGSFPSGLIIGKFNGVDIRKYGSGNIGATNVRRVLGRDWSTLCFLLDFLKGFLPVLLFGKMLGAHLLIGSGMGSIVAALAAVMGHIFPVWLRFKGGKGVATSLGVAAGISFWPLLIGGVAWLIIFEWKRMVSLASMIAVLVLFISSLCFRLFRPESIQWHGVILFAILAILVIVRHRDNIKRIMRGEESRFDKKKK